MNIWIIVAIAVLIHATLFGVSVYTMTKAKELMAIYDNSIFGISFFIPLYGIIYAIVRIEAKYPHRNKEGS